jgi:hypothetical protein
VEWGILLDDCICSEILVDFQFQFRQTMEFNRCPSQSITRPEYIDLDYFYAKKDYFSLPLVFDLVQGHPMMLT